MTKENGRVLTGLQASGFPHLGNYFGAIKPLLGLCEGRDVFLFLADLHVINTRQEAETNRKNTLELAATLLACGFDHEKQTFYSQSAVPEVTELMWYLSCFAPFGLLTRAHSYKDKVAKGIEVNAGLFNYPLLMAADILLYDAALVPVGKDQKQHLEITRDLAERFNAQYGEVFRVPEPMISDDVGVVPGIDGEKMSKSKNNVISIFATDKIWRQQVMSIVTDSKGLDEPKDPDTCHVVSLYKLMASKEELAVMTDSYRKGGYGYGHAKMALLAKIGETFGPARERYWELMKRPDDILDMVAVGAKKARKVATKKLEQVQAALGLTGRSRP